MACSFTSSLPALIIAAPATAPPSGPNSAPALILPAGIAPEVVAGLALVGGQPHLASHGEAKPEAVAIARQIERPRHDPRAEMIRRHVRDRARAEVAPTVEHAAVQQHLEKPRVVGRRRHHAAAA